jgi:hemoglobin
MQKRDMWGCLAILGVLVMVSSAGVLGQSSPKHQTLSERLGGEDAISAVVDRFVGHVAADARINGFFAKTASDPHRLKTFKMNLVNQICEASGGPCKYSAKDMKSAHMGMGVSGTDFDALVEDFWWALDRLHVGKTEEHELLAALGPMKIDIVEKH